MLKVRFAFLPHFGSYLHSGKKDTFNEEIVQLILSSSYMTFHRVVMKMKTWWTGKQCLTWFISWDSFVSRVAILVYQCMP